MNNESLVSKGVFNPSWIHIFTNPFYIARKSLYKNIALLAKDINGNLLDVGCGSKPYKHLFNVSSYIGLEIESTQYIETKTDIDVFYDGKIFPFQDKSFKNIICNQVFEHVFEPKLFMSELNRVLEIDGKLLLTVPFLWDEHEQPFDYARYSSFGIKSILEENGFEIIQHIKSVNNVSLIYQLINCYIYKKVKFSKWLRIITTISMMSFITFSGLIAGYIFPKNDDLYIDNIILAKKTKDIHA